MAAAGQRPAAAGVRRVGRGGEQRYPQSRAPRIASAPGRSGGEAPPGAAAGVGGTPVMLRPPSGLGSGGIDGGIRGDPGAMQGEGGCVVAV